MDDLSAGGSREPLAVSETADQSAFGVRLLGPMQILSAGAPVTPRPLRPRSLLALLALHVNVTVSMDRIVTALWSEPPDSARQQIYNIVAIARRSLGVAERHARIEHIGSGYQLSTDDRHVDVVRFRRGVERAKRAEAQAEPALAIHLLESALDEWRGTALADFEGEYFASAATLLLDERLEAVERLSGLLLADEPGRVVKRLAPLVSEHPFHEPLRALLMRGLYLVGRRADALSVFEDGRRLLSAELGVSPGTGLQEAYRQVLSGDQAPSPAAAATRRPAAAAGAVARGRQPKPPCQLPADVRLLVGRERETADLIALAEAAGDAAEDGLGAVTVAVIDGMGGVGKSALAVHVAHRLRTRFPDGQLYIDLHGHTPGRNPVTPADALYHFLQALGVPPQQVPDDTDMRASCFRDRLADTRTLILLDNAASTQQVRALLPGTGGCTVLVTSRRRLIGLGDAHQWSLDTLTGEVAVDLLRRASGRGPGQTRGDHDAADHDAADHDDEAAAALAKLCGHLPLAIRIVAARLKNNRASSVRALVAELRDEDSRLGRLNDGERELIGVFGSSLKVLPEQGQRLYRLLGLVPGADFDAYTAANLLGTDLYSAKQLLELLLDHNMLLQHVPDRYRFHDLIHAHARGLSTAEDDDEGAEPRERLFDYYLRTAWAADRRLATRHRHDGSVLATRAGAAPEITDQDAATAWMRSELPNLLAAVAGGGLGPQRTVALISALSSHLMYEGPWNLGVELHRRAVSIAGEAGDELAEANALLDVSGFLERFGDLGTVIENASRVRPVYRRLGDRLGEAHSLSLLGQAAYVQGRLADSVVLSEQALAAYREVGDQRDAARNLYRLGAIRSFQGANAEAADLLGQAAAIYVEIGEARGEANCLLNYSRVLYSLHDFQRVRPTLDRALRLNRRGGVLNGIANILQETATYQVRWGEYAEAAENIEEALQINREMGFPLGEGYDHMISGRIKHATGDLDGALLEHERALALFRRIGAIYVPSALEGIARAHHARGESEPAAAALDEALSLCEADGGSILDIQVEVRNAFADLMFDTQGPARAFAEYETAAELAIKGGVPLEHARAMEGMARCEIGVGQTEAGIKHLSEAVDLYGRIGAVEYRPAAAYLAEVSRG